MEARKKVLITLENSIGSARLNAVWELRLPDRVATELVIFLLKS
jgi:hypothetical protein